jgi:hypothetical protein
MPLSRGQKLLHFTLVDKIGEGGMGEVWKAVDTTLDREVAIKVLPEAFSSDRERMARLEREAKVLAALSHTNIAGIYGFPEADGRTGGGERVRFLAMELARGEDLAQILARGPMPISEALDAARQIAAALEAAHASGIVHRDLKPANIKRTPDGQIKVLDFGLAKALEGAGASVASGATVTSAGSVPGLIVGTASYMSPEQARGQAVDRRTDLWAFGCVLYEMLSGTRAFEGATVTDVLAAVVSSEPQWSRLPAATPAAVRRLLRRCLEKDVRKRLRDAGDASLLLEDNPEDMDAALRHDTAGRPAARPRWNSAIALALLAAGAIVGIAGGWWLAQRRTGATTTAPSFKQLTFNRGMIRTARFASDGRTIVYGASWGGPPVKLYLARTESPETAPLAVPPAELLAISKSGEVAVSLGHSYYGWMGEGTLARTSPLGGAPREVLQNIRSADWSPDESQLAVARHVTGGDQLEYPVGTVLDKTTGYFGDVRISPDGNSVAYADHPAWGDNRGNVAMVDRQGKKTILVPDLEAIQGLAWAPGGKEIWYTDHRGGEGRVMAVDLRGKLRTVHASISPLELFDIGADGRLLLGQQRSQRETLALLAGFSEPRMLFIPGDATLTRGITADGHAVLVVNHATHQYETFLVRSDRPGAVLIASGDAMAISPDHAWVLTNSPNLDKLFVTPTSMGPTRTLPNPDRIEYQSLASWLPDSKRFLLTGKIGASPSRAFVCDLESGAGKPFGPPGVQWPIYTGPPVSPDGQKVVLQDVDGTFKMWPVAGGNGVPIAGTRPQDQPLTFTEDGAALFVAGQSLPIEIERLELASGKRTHWMSGAPTDPAGLRFTLATITPNGKYWAMSTAKMLTHLYLVEGMR